MKIAAKGATATAPPPADPAATARLVAALDVVLAASDAISNCVRAFSALGPDEPIPASWVARAVELHVRALEAWWVLDDEAAIDAAAGGWTVGPPHAIGTPVERRRTRIVWETELMKPQGAALWWDRGMVAVKAASSEAAVEEAGRALVTEGARRRYADWQNVRSDR